MQKVFFIYLYFNFVGKSRSSNKWIGVSRSLGTKSNFIIPNHTDRNIDKVCINFISQLDEGRNTLRRGKGRTSPRARFHSAGFSIISLFFRLNFSLVLSILRIM